MKYIIDSKEVSRDTFYFCQRSKEEHKTFVLLNPNNNIETNINRHPEYDYYIYDEIKTYYTKGEATTSKWFEKEYYSWSKCTPEDITKRYNKSKFKDTMTFNEWYTKNGWKYYSETKYKVERHNIPTTRNFKEKDVKTKLFSVRVMHKDTVSTINKLEDELGDCIEYVLRDNNFTEIIYRDCYLEIKEEFFKKRNTKK